MIKVTKIIKGIAMGILVLSFMGMASAEAEEIKKKVTIKELQGEVSGLSNNFIAIIYAQDKKTSYEMAFTMDKNLRIENRKSLSDIAVGDIVSVSFEETSETKKQGNKDISRIAGRLVKKIRFIRPGAKVQEIEMRSLEEAEREEAE